MDSVKINGQTYNLYKNLQDFVKYTMQKLLETNSLSDSNLDFPLLSKDKDAFAKDKQHCRYYAESGFFVKGYYLCNHWFDKDEKFFANWLKGLVK